MNKQEKIKFGEIMKGLDKCPFHAKCPGYVGGKWCIEPECWVQCENQKLLKKEMNNEKYLHE